MQELDRLTADILDEEQRELVDCIGIEAYRRLIGTYGGLNVYICKAETLLRNDRNSRIQKEFNGGNYKYLARKYGLTEQTIRNIVFDELETIRHEPVEGQISFQEIL